MPIDPKVGIQIKASDKTKSAFKSVDNNLRSMTRGIGAAKTAMLGLIGVGGFTTLAVRSLNAADAIAKASERTAFATDTLQELRFAADQTGVSVNELEGGLARFTKRLGLARAGTGAAADTYRKLGIDLSQTNNQVFRQVVDTLGSMEDQTNRLALTTRLFGDDAQKLELTFRGGTAALDAFGEKARSLGLVLDQDLVRNAEKANDQLSIMKQVIDVQFTQVFISLAPAIVAVGKAFAEAAPHISAFVSGFRDIEERSKLATQQTIENLEGRADAIVDELARIYAVQDNNRLGTLGDVFFGLDDPRELEGELARINGRLFRAREHLEALNSQPLDITISGGAVDTAGLFGKQDEEFQKYQSHLQKKLDALNQFLMTERERELMQFETRQFLVEESFQNLLIGETERKATLEGLEQQHQQTLTEIAARGGDERAKFALLSYKKQTKFIVGELVNMTQGTAQQTRAMFEINKIASTAQAVMKGIESVQNSYAWGTSWGGPPAGAAMAAIAAAATAANVAAIQATSFGSGGVAPSLSATGATSTVAAVPTLPPLSEQTETATVTIQFLGDVYGLDDFQEVVLNTVSDAVNDRDVVIIDPASRQATELST